MTRAKIDESTPQPDVMGTAEALRWIWNSAGAERDRLVRGYLFKALESIAACLPALVLILALDSLQDGGRPDNRQIAIWTGMIAGAVLLRWVLGIIANKGCWVASYRFVRDLRVRVLAHLVDVPMGQVKIRQSGNLASTLTQDLRMIELLPSMAIPSLIAAIVGPLTITVGLFFVDWRLALVLLCTLPLALVAYTVTQRQMQRLSKRRQDIQADSTAQIVEYVQGISVIRAFRQRGSGIARFERSMDEMRAIDDLIVRRVSTWSAVFSTVLELGVLLMLMAGVWMLFDGDITTITFLIFLVLSVRAFEPFHELVTFGGIARIGEASLTRVNELLEIPALPEPEHDRPLTSFGIEFDNVSFSYRDDAQNTVPVLRNVSFAAEPRSMTALVGPSGSGKTTITSLIARFWDVDEGTVVVGGQDVRDLRSATLNASLSMVFQDVYLFEDTILNNIRFGRPSATFDEVVEAAKSAHCHEFISRLPEGYETLVGEGGATLSGGERQRISIARALLKDAPIVLLDEATASVDPSNENLIQAAIDALVADKTLVIIAHRLSTIQNADQILVLSEGRISERGTHEQLLLNSGLYTRFWSERQRARSWSITETSSAPAQIAT